MFKFFRRRKKKKEHTSPVYITTNSTNQSALEYFQLRDKIIREFKTSVKYRELESKARKYEDIIKRDKYNNSRTKQTSPFFADEAITKFAPATQPKEAITVNKTYPNLLAKQFERADKETN